MTILTASQTWPFGAALAVMLGLALLEVAGLMMASSPSVWLDHFMPHLHVDADGPLGWLQVGRVPLLVLLILFLAGFSMSGYAIQAVAYHQSGELLSPLLASIPASLAGIAAWAFGGAVVGRLLPGDQTSAVSELSLIGRAGVLMRGTAVRGHAAEAKVYDSFGRAHYVMVEPEDETQSLAEGCAVLLVGKVGARFHCIVNPYATTAQSDRP